MLRYYHKSESMKKVVYDALKENKWHFYEYRRSVINENYILIGLCTWKKIPFAV